MESVSLFRTHSSSQIFYGHVHFPQRVEKQRAGSILKKEEISKKSLNASAQKVQLSYNH